MKFAKIVLIPAGIFVITVLAGTALGVRLNVTPSVPTGLYLQHAPQHDLRRGMLVVACLDLANPAATQAMERGYLPDGDCPGGIAPVLKPVAALGGDHVEATPAGLSVNGVLIAGTASRERDPQGRPLPRPAQRYVVASGTVLLLSHNPGSFDGRYFGPVATASIRAEARPLLLF